MKREVMWLKVSVYKQKCQLVQTWASVCPGHGLAVNKAGTASALGNVARAT